MSSSSASPLSLKVKGGKPFGVFSKLTDEESLTRTWKVASQVANELEHGHRIENLSWRLWHLRDVLSSSEQRLNEEERFTSITKSLSHQLDNDKKKPILDLKTPIFRWTDQNDAVRHLGVLRLQRREEARIAAQEKMTTSIDNRETTAESSSHHSPSVNAKVAAITDKGTTMGKKEGVNRVKGKGRGADQHHTTSDDSCSSSSSSTPASYLRLRRRQQRVKGSEKASRQSSTPPVCWRLTKAEADRRQKQDQDIAESFTSRQSIDRASPDPVVSTDWTLEDIEAAEKELREQGVELSGPFVAMLADLKRGQLSRVKREIEPSWSLSEDVTTAALRQMVQADQQSRAATSQHQYPRHYHHHTHSSSVPFQQQYAPSLRPSLHSLDVSGPSVYSTLPSSVQQASPMNILPQSAFVASTPASSIGSIAMHSGYSTPQVPNYSWSPQQQQQVPRPHHHRHSSSSVSLQPLPQIDTKKDTTKVKPETESRSGPKPQCVNCGATSTPLWRRDSKFNLQCNACGLYEKLHKAPRPKEFKHRRTDKRVREISPSGSDAQSAAKSPLRRSSAASSTKDEWVGIHSGSTCANCGTSTTPLWRKDSDGRIICNACGLYYKLHDSHRPVAMRVDAIKRRSRHDDRGRKLAKAANTPTDSATFDFASVSGSETGGPLQQTHSHLLNDGTLTSASPLSAIHIPSDLWDNQLCPMGAWGENCCQNLPQPDENHAHQYTTLPSAGNQTLQTADQTTMDSILGTDWLIPYSDQSPVTSTVTTGVPTASTPVSAMQFDPTSIQGNGASETIVGPSFSLKKRKFNATTSNVSNVTTSPTSWWPFDAQIQSQSQSNSPSKASEEK